MIGELILDKDFFFFLSILFLAKKLSGSSIFTNEILAMQNSGVQMCGPSECLLYVDSSQDFACSLTKWVPPPVKMTSSYVQENINVSRKRMDVACLDMLQFHWYLACSICIFS